MKPTRDIKCTLVDLVDTILNKGVVINADVIISVAGVPLIGVNLKAAIAGMETMLKYGMMEAWDESVRREYAHEIAKMNKPPLMQGEEIILGALGSHYYSEGIYSAWRPGNIYLTDKRLFLFRKVPAEMLFETPLEKIKGLTIKEDGYLVGVQKERLYVLLESGKVVCLNTEDLVGLKKAIEKRMEAMRLTLEEEIALPQPEAFQFLEEGEEVVQAEKVWYQAPASGIIAKTWKPGWMYVTNKRLCWCHDSNHKPMFEIPIDDITKIAIEREEAIQRNPRSRIRNKKAELAGSTPGDIIMNTPLDTIMDAPSLPDIEKYDSDWMKRKERILALSHKSSDGEGMALFSGRGEKLRRLAAAIEKEQEALAA